MKTILLIASCLVLLSCTTIAQGHVRVELSTHSDMWSSFPEGEESLDGFRATVALEGRFYDSVVVGPALRWENRYHHVSHWDGEVPDWWARGDDSGATPGWTNLLVLSLRVRLDPGRIGLQPFVLAESGAVVGDAIAPDVLISLQAGACWRMTEALSISIGVGQCLYVEASRYSIPVSLDVAMQF